VQELARGWKDDSETLPLIKQRAATDEDRAVRRTAVRELARRWGDDPEVRAFLKELEKKEG
jgi:hypothetical protein